MEWVAINESDTQWALVDDEYPHRSDHAVVFLSYHAKPARWSYITANALAGNHLFETKEEAQEAAIVAYVTERIEQ
jgi:hypothetical protein